MPFLLLCFLSVAFAIGCDDGYTDPSLNNNGNSSTGTTTSPPPTPAPTGTLQSFQIRTDNNVTEVNVGRTLQFVAFGTFSDGRSNVQLTSGVTWSVDKTAIATIDPATGLLTGVGVGDVIVSASAQGASGPISASNTVPIAVDESPIGGDDGGGDGGGPSPANIPGENL